MSPQWISTKWEDAYSCHCDTGGAEDSTGWCDTPPRSRSTRSERFLKVSTVWTSNPYVQSQDEGERTLQLAGCRKDAAAMGPVGDGVRRIQVLPCVERPLTGIGNSSASRTACDLQRNPPG